MKKFTIVTGLHGNEPIPTIALASHKIDQIVANPKALAQGKRFIDMDMNKAFNTDGDTYEENRAREILDKIPHNIPVLDLHTMSAPSVPFAIVIDLEMVPIASTLGLEHVVYMKHNIKSGHALINARSGVSVEVGNHESLEAFDNTLEIVDNAKKGISKTVKVYEVFDKITEAGDYTNFKKHPDGFVPILAGEKAYDFYGLKGREISL